MNERYSYFDHDADIGIIGRGKSLERGTEGRLFKTKDVYQRVAPIKVAPPYVF